MSDDQSTGAFRIGLTGGIASGKSTVADMFAHHGVPIIDTDVIAREVVAPGQPAIGEVVAAFGPEILRDDGQLDRAALRRIVFSSEERRRALEAILHPRIREAAARRAASAGGPYQVIVVPLLVGSPLRHWMDRILVVDVPEEVQLERLLQRDAEDPEQARGMIAAQAGRDARLAIADDVVDNGADLSETRRQVEALHRRYLELAERPRDT